jgi:mRNA-degrading endonuclease RelE of RelBE toxin-antitoxin system
VRSHTTQRFRQLLADLPKEIQKQAREAYNQFEHNPCHPGLNFKRIHSRRPIYAVRISRDYRALGIQENVEIVWFWIGSHSDYDKLLKQLRQS